MRPVHITFVLPPILVLTLAGVAPAEAPRATYEPRAAVAEADSNGDGHVDHAEFVERITEVYYLNDTNRDGSLSSDEARATLVVTDNLLEADANGDGRLTVHEFLRARMQDFRAADGNRDGLLSVDEVVTAYQGKQK